LIIVNFPITRDSRAPNLITNKPFNHH
jgi:hypothetical protein